MATIKRNKKRPGYTSNNVVKLVQGGKPYFDCVVSMLKTAKETIHLQTYIFDDDETGELVANALKEAAGRKVRVFVLVDGYASQSLPDSFINGLKNAGIEFRFFSPLLKSPDFYIGRRLHHKVVVVDGKYSLVGGVNISNKYNDMPAQKAWLDFAVYAEGEVARELCVLCWKTWYNYPSKMPVTSCEGKILAIDNATLQKCEVSMRRNDWVRRKNEISVTYIDMLRKAEAEITILCSYFLPGRIIRRQLSYAARRGVKIKVITAGVSDVKVAKNAERYMYAWLLKNNIELYEYQLTVLHGKIAVCDGQLVTAGSYNINNISAYASIELNLAIRNDFFASEVQEVLAEIAKKDCIRITNESYLKGRTMLRQFVNWSSYQFIRLGFFLFTFYFKHKD